MNIVPYKSVGTVEFGMTPEQVRQEMGVPLKTGKNILGEVKVLYTFFNVEFSGEAVVEVTLGPSEEVTVNGRVIRTSAEGREDLLSLSNLSYQGNGTLVLVDIGIAIPEGFDSPYPLTAFARGRMDSVLSTYRKLS